MKIDISHKINIIERAEKLRAKGIHDPYIERMARMFKEFKGVK